MSFQVCLCSLKLFFSKLPACPPLDSTVTASFVFKGKKKFVSWLIQAFLFLISYSLRNKDCYPLGDSVTILQEAHNSERNKLLCHQGPEIKFAPSLPNSSCFCSCLRISAQIQTLLDILYPKLCHSR